MYRKNIRAEKVDAAFAKVMQSLQPSKGMVALVTKMLKDAWSQRHAHICARNPEAPSGAYRFFPEYTNRNTARDVVRRQFSELLKRADLEIDHNTGKKFSLYSLRHTAICMRIVNSKCKVNIYNFATTAGTF